MCVCIGTYMHSPCMCMSCLPSWKWFYFEWRHNQNLLATSWQVVGGFEFKPRPGPSPSASPACRRSDRSALISAAAGAQLKWRNRFDFEARVHAGCCVF